MTDLGAVVGFLAFAAALSSVVLWLYLWVRADHTADPVDDRGRMEAAHDRFLRDHLSQEAPTVVEAHFVDHPEDLATQCPHLPVHRELVTAETGPMGSVEVMAWLCRLCGQQTYVAGQHG